MATITNDTVRHWDRYTEGWERQDPEAAMAAFAPGGTIVDPSRDEPMTGEEIGEQLGLTFPAVIGQLPKLAIGTVRNAL